MTRIPFIAISLTFLVLSGCSNTEIPSEPNTTTTSLPQPPNAQVRTLDPATFTAQSRETFCDAVQDAIDKRHTVDTGNFGPEVTLSEFNRAIHHIAKVAAVEESDAWGELAQFNTYGEMRNTEKSDTTAFLRLYDELEPTVEQECNLPMP